MRIVIAMMQHETNTFSPVPTPLERFSRGNSRPFPFEDEEVRSAFKGTGTAIGAYIDSVSYTHLTLPTNREV